MTEDELNREIERAQRNAKKLAALEAENEKAARELSAVLGRNTTTPASATPVVRRHPAMLRA